MKHLAIAACLTMGIAQPSSFVSRLSPLFSGPFSGIALTAYWQLGYPGTANPEPYLTNYPDLTGRGNALQPFPNASTGNSTANFNVGANNGGGQTSSTYYAHYGIWSRQLTSAEHNDLAGGDVCAGSPCSFTLSSLNNGLKCYWLFGEASGTAVHHADTSGNSCPALIDSGSSVQETGPNGGADKATFYSSGSYGTSAASAKTNPGTGDYSYFIAVNLQSLPSNTQAVFNCQLDLSAKVGAVCAYYQGQGATTFNTDHGNGVDLVRSGVVANSALIPGANTWYGLGYSFNSTTGLETMYVNGTSNAASFTRAYFPSPFSFTPLACYGIAGFTSSWDCSNYGASAALVVPSTSDIGFSNSSRTWAFWVDASGTSSGTLQAVAGEFNANTRELHLAAEFQSSTVYLLSGTFGANNFQYCSTAITDGSHFLLYYYDASDGSQHAYLDNVAFSTCQSVTHMPTLGTLPFYVGVQQDTGAAYGVSAPVASGTVVSRMLFANGVPTSGDRAILYNSGNGWVYP